MARDRRQSGDVTLMLNLLMWEMFADDPPAKKPDPPPQDAAPSEKPSTKGKQSS